MKTRRCKTQSRPRAIVMKRRYYISFPTNVTEAEADRWLKRWKAQRDEPEGPPAILDGELTLAVTGEDDLPAKVKQLPGAGIYENEARPELM
jgi:hypothetical protein